MRKISDISLLRESELLYVKRCWLILFILPSVLSALPTDVDQPIEIEADFAELNDEKRTTIYIGNVVVIQGSIRMTGDSLKVVLTDDRQIEEAHLEGRPATFKQTPNIGEEDVEGEAKTIEYFSDKEIVHLIDGAKVIQGKRLTQGHRINYDIERSIVTVRSLRANMINKDRVEKNRSQRVKIILPPPEEERGAD